MTPEGREALEQAARLLREWAGDRSRIQGKWTSREQAGIECAIALEAFLLVHPQEIERLQLEIRTAAAGAPPQGSLRVMLLDWDARLALLLAEAHPQGDTVCEHGHAIDVHCCNCHSGFIFDRHHQCPEERPWLPIDSAPKDGHDIELTDGSYELEGYWAKGICSWSLKGAGTGVTLNYPTHWREKRQDDKEYWVSVSKRILDVDGAVPHDWLVEVAKRMKEQFGK